MRPQTADSTRDLTGPDQVVAVRLGATPAPDISLTPVLAVKLTLAAAPRIAAHVQILEAAWWSRQNLLTPTISEVGWEKAWRALGLTGKVTARHRRFSSYAAALEAACSGQGVLLAALPFAETEFGTGRLVRLSKFQMTSPVRFSIAMRIDVAARGFPDHTA
jgi:DNA-binding transcriptional LysR family regulator